MSIPTADRTSVKVHPFINTYIVRKIEFALVLKKFHRNDRPYRRSRTRSNLR
ncbi:hypothetical protein [Microcoleus sp. B9-D4]|uniref:hypothetical protein n=1 Tax=Microcoleus sp. B9-D4 TaxID=2818711 RepID=UPI002FD03AB5